MTIPIIFEDDFILVIDKPYGVVVNKSETQKEETIQDWLNFRYKAYLDLTFKNQSSIADSEFLERSGIVHRLDKDTSGVMVIAKTPEAFENLQAQFKDRGVQKEYTALVHGDIEGSKNLGKTFTINAPIARNPKNRTKQAVVEGGRDAVTDFRIINTFQDKKTGDKYTLVEASPKTGRMHQIRVHLTAFNHPIVSDLLYSGRRRFRMDTRWCPRMFLHAKRLEFTHPVSGKRVKFESDLPKKLVDVLNDSRFKV